MAKRMFAAFAVDKRNDFASTTVAQNETAQNESQHGKRYRVFLGVGSNLGDKFHNIQTGLKLLCRNESEVKLGKTSFLHETAPMYLDDQPSFLNGAVMVETSLSPHHLLNRLKKVEKEMGRNFSQVRNGPRPLDLDILFCDQVTNGSKKTAFEPVLVDTSDLTVPHARIEEREFVLRPLCEVAGSGYVHPRLNKTIGELEARLPATSDPAVRVLSLLRDRKILFRGTIVMGILNLTPDSFSDGGKWAKNTGVAVEHALRMEREGASIIDIGGESTRPGAKEVTEDEQIRRTVHVIEAIRGVSDIPISIDTRNSRVAQAAIEAGADIVNDVSGGCHDPAMLSTVAALGVPIILMHMRGTPQTMQSMTDYNDVVEEVALSLRERIRAAEESGIPRWLLVVDPGIGFAKDLAGSLRLLKNLKTLRSSVGNVPILLGTSRKGFIGKLSGVAEPELRDFGTIASMIAPLCLEGDSLTCTILRVHNVTAACQASKIMDAIKGS